MDDGIVALAGQRPVASGRIREVYLRPGRPDQVLKVVKADRLKAFERRSSLSQRLRRARLGPYSTFLMETKEQARVAYRAERLGRRVPIAEIGGIVRTDLGLAQVCTRVTDGVGGQGRRLTEILRGGPAAEDVARLNAFAEDLYALRVCAHDLAERNVMLDGASGRLLLVDGFGDKTVVPMRRILPGLLIRRLDARFARMARGDLRWDAGTRRFVMG